MKMTYWMAECLYDSSAYNVRAKTKREVVNMVADNFNPDDYGEPKKVEVEYDSTFDLLLQCLGEGRGYWEI